MKFEIIQNESMLGLSIVSFQLQCCGVDRPDDWFYSKRWPTNQYVPDSCCNITNFASENDTYHCGMLPENRNLWHQRVDLSLRLSQRVVLLGLLSRIYRLVVPPYLYHYMVGCCTRHC